MSAVALRRRRDGRAGRPIRTTRRNPRVFQRARRAVRRDEMDILAPSRRLHLRRSRTRIAPGIRLGRGPHHRISRPRHARTLAERETLRERIVERGRRERRARRHDRTPERALRRPVIGAPEARREAVPRRRDPRTAFRKTRTTPVRRIDAHVLPPDRPPADERRRRHGRHGARRTIVHIGIANVHGLVDMRHSVFTRS